MRAKKITISWLVVLAVLSVVAHSAIAADADVLAECAYWEDEETTVPSARDTVLCYIYADINGFNLYSFGVNLAYNDAKLTVSNAESNMDVWFLGDESYTDAYLSPGNAVTIGGKLDPNVPTAGVGGQRVLLSKVAFTRDVPGEPISPNAATYFGIGLGLGKPDPYANFVDNSGDPLQQVLDNKIDGVAFEVKVAEGGDADAGGTINATDAQFVSSIFFGTSPWSVFADCNGDGDINAVDAQCISAKFFGG